MKKAVITLCATFVLFSAFMLQPFKSGIHGTIDPADGAQKVWALNGTDSVSAVPMSGKFSLEVAPGKWKLFVEATPPYKNTTLENITVREEEYTDAGVIRLTSE
jgi:hypothetical protein